MNVIFNPYMTRQFRFPRSKRKRIRNKWKKNPANFIPDTKMYMANNDTFIMHPLRKAHFELLMKAIDARLPKSPSLSIGYPRDHGECSATSVDHQLTELIIKGRCILKKQGHPFPHTDDLAIKVAENEIIKRLMKTNMQIAIARSRIMDSYFSPAVVISKDEYARFET